MAKKGHTKESHDWSGNFGTLMLGGTREQGNKWNCALSSWQWMLWLMHLHCTNTFRFICMAEWIMTLHIPVYLQYNRPSFLSHLPFLIIVGLGFLMSKKIMFSISHVHSLTIILDPDCPSTDHKYPAVKTPMFSTRPKRYKCFILVEGEFVLISHM